MPPAATKTAHHRNARALVKETWEARANLSFFLSLLVLFVFVLPLTNLVEQHMSLYVDIGYSLMLISGITVAWGRSRLFYAGTLVGVIGLLVRWIGWWHPAVARFREPTTLAAIFFLILLLIIRVFRKGTVSASRLQGAIALYLLLGLLWAHMYVVFNQHRPDAFSYNENTPTTVAGWTYFSFITLTTVGYGDITPKAPAARMLAVGEALTGQLYLAVMLARLVALQVSGDLTQNSAADPREKED